MNPPPAKRTWKQRFKQVLLTVLVIGTGCFGWWLWRMFVLVSDEIPTAYAGWAAGELIETHLFVHTNQWPRGIADLQAAVSNRHETRLIVHHDVNQLTNHIAINWSVDVNVMRESAKTRSSHPLLVTRRDGKPINPVWGTDVEPNYVIGKWLNLPTGFLRATN